jgi:hypothetical protein
MAKKDYVVWLPEDEYRKILGQFRLNLHDTLGCFNMYGLGELIPGAEEEIMDLLEASLKRVRGRDVPIQIKKERNSRK